MCRLPLDVSDFEEDIDESFVSKICGGIDDERKQFTKASNYVGEEAFLACLKDKSSIELLSKDCFTSFWNRIRGIELGIKNWGPRILR
jgi:hypothetical protein